MKHPREILFEHHRPAAPKLDAIRKRSLANLSATEAEEARHHSRRVGLSIRELLRSFRWHLAGMSAAWVLTAFLNADPAPTEAPNITAQEVPAPRQLLTALRENRRQIAELLESPMTSREPAPAPPAFVPKRRGEAPSTNAMA